MNKIIDERRKKETELTQTKKDEIVEFIENFKRLNLVKDLFNNRVNELSQEKYKFQFKNAIETETNFLFDSMEKKLKHLPEIKAILAKTPFPKESEIKKWIEDNFDAAKEYSERIHEQIMTIYVNVLKDIEITRGLLVAVGKVEIPDDDKGEYLSSGLSSKEKDEGSEFESMSGVICMSDGECFPD